MEYKVLRSFGGNIRGSKVDLSKKDADALLAGSAPYIEAVSGGSKPSKRVAKKTAAKQAAATPDPAPEVTDES